MLVEMTTKKAIEILMEFPEDTVLVSVIDLEGNNESLFSKRLRKDCITLFDDAKYVISNIDEIDDYVKQMNIFTEHQNLLNIKKIGKQKIILL